MLRTTHESCWLYRRLTCAAGLLALAMLLAFPGLAQAGTRSYELRWRVPPDPDVARYTVYLAFESMGYGEGMDIGFQEPDAQGVARYTLTDLDDSVDYYVVMDAVNEAGLRSPYSNEIMVEHVVAADPCAGVVCDDGDACTIDACDPASGVCSHTPDTTSPECRPDLCANVNCSDGNACTIDACDPETGTCSHSSIDCNDGDACTTDSCNPANGTCSHSSIDCNDGDACTTDSCNPASGACSHESIDCSDGDACTTDTCDPASGACSHESIDCSDGDACTTDTCDPASGACSHESIDCSDGDACTTDTCDPASGACSHKGVDCNDGNACTTDSCDPGSGTCSHESIDCSDGDACTHDSCDPGSGICAYEMDTTSPECRVDLCDGVDCSDGDACTADTCDPETGLCAHEPDTTSPACQPDLCNGVDCNDGDACTADACNPETGLCAHVPDAADPACQNEEPPGDVGCDDVFDAPSGARLSWTDDPSTTTTVIWDAPLHSAGSQLRHRRYGTTQWSTLGGRLLSFQDCDARYIATIEGLEPDSRYEYQVSGPSARGQVWTRRQDFRTAPKGDGNLTFAFFASSGIDGALHSDLAAEVAEALRGDAFVLGGGGYAYAVDAVASGLGADAPAVVDAWLDQASQFAKGAPLLPVYGDTDATSPEQRSYYADAHPTLQSGSYSFDAGPVHFTALEAATLDALDPATAEGAALLDWLDADLGQARARGANWLVVYMHADPVSSQAGHPGAGAALDAFGAILTAHQVSLVLSGDGHSSERSYPLLFKGSGPEVGSTQASRVFPTDGTVFLRTGLGGRVDFAGWASSEPPAWSAFRDNQVASFVRVDVRGTRGMVVTLMGIEPGRSRLSTLDRFVVK